MIKKTEKNGVVFLSRAISISQAISKTLPIALRKMLVNSQASVITSFTRNFPGEQQPIDSGLLRASIKRKATSENEGEIFTNKHYAPHVEYGTVKMRARPFFRKGMADVEEKNRNTIRFELNKRVK